MKTGFLPSSARRKTYWALGISSEEPFKTIGLGPFSRSVADVSVVSNYQVLRKLKEEFTPPFGRL